MDNADVANNWYTDISVNTWDEIQAKERKFDNSINIEKKWVFRGDLISTTVPITSLEKVFNLYGILDQDKRQYERNIIREFQRKASLYLDHEPDKNDIIEWLAVMQHHGAPTRLLDCTYSFYVALYFSLANNINGCIWAINSKTMSNTPEILKNIETHFYVNNIQSEYEHINNICQSQSDILNIRSEGDKITDIVIVSCLFKEPTPLLYPINPFRFNKRITTQQGLFLILGDSKISLKNNLFAVFNCDTKEMKENIYRISFQGTPDDRKEIIRKLKEMNITNETLFPGTDGFAKSTAELLAWLPEYPWHPPFPKT
jgi:hypothetical protein